MTRTPNSASPESFGVSQEDPKSPPMNSTDLSSLLGRVEAATGPNIALDTQIAIALRDGAGGYPNYPLGSHNGGYVQADMGRLGWSVAWRVPPYTASLDVALALCERVLPGVWWHVAKGKLRAAEPLFGAILYFTRDEELGAGESDASPALALLAAMLKALIALEVA